MSTISSAGCRAASIARAHLVDAAGAAGRGLVVHDADRLDAVRLVVGERGADRRHVGAAAPVGVDEDRLEAEPLRHLVPQRGEPAGAAHQHRVAGRQRVGQRRLPRAGAGGRDRSPPGRWSGRSPAGWSRISSAQLGRSRGRDGRWSGCRWRAAPGPARWWGRGSAGNAGRRGIASWSLLATGRPDVAPDRQSLPMKHVRARQRQSTWQIQPSEQLDLSARQRLQHGRRASGHGRTTENGLHALCASKSTSVVLCGSPSSSVSNDLSRFDGTGRSPDCPCDGLSLGRARGDAPASRVHSTTFLALIASAGQAIDRARAARTRSARLRWIASDQIVQLHESRTPAGWRRRGPATRSASEAPYDKPPEHWIGSSSQSFSPKMRFR